jgi:hypothetical protein
LCSLFFSRFHAFCSASSAAPGFSSSLSVFANFPVSPLCRSRSAPLLLRNFHLDWIGWDWIGLDRCKHCTYRLISEVKERAKKAKVEKKKVDAKSGKKAAPAPGTFEKVPKSRRLAAKPKATTR